MNKKLTVAVIGCGAFAKNFVPLFKNHPNVEKVYVCDIVEEKALEYSKEFDVEITAIHQENDNINRGLELKVTDETLLQTTGGIVQGMSGSPIIQDGKIVGAVTHVLVNDPTRGYGIFIENMLVH